MSTATDEPSPDKPQFLGDYRLLEALGEGPITRVWLAEQPSVGRTVVIEELRPDAPESREEFVADVRSKASVGHPLIGSVYEAVTTDGHCFFAREQLGGNSLAERLETRRPIKPLHLAPVLRKIAEAQLHLETRDLAAGALDLCDIHLDQRGVVRINNLGIAGTRKKSASSDDIARLGRHLRPLVADGHPGATRAHTLLRWMAGEDPNVAPLTWRKVHDYATQIEGQLAEPLPPVAPPTGPATSNYRSGGNLTRWLCVALAAVVVAGLAWFALRPDKSTQPSLPTAIHIPAGNHPSPNGGTQQLPGFWISAHSVTIAEYARFLAALEGVKPEHRDAYDHEDQPTDKSDHQPDDWAAILAAAEAGEPWNELPLSPEFPVVNVDWFDAYAYCEWKRGRLPSQEEWFAALNFSSTDVAALEPAPWGPVASSPADRTPAGIHDLAGNVAEWTRRPAPNPSQPMAGKKPVIAGTSYLNPDGDARAREWVASRSLRRPDLGFRVAFEYQPE